MRDKKKIIRKTRKEIKNKIEKDSKVFEKERKSGNGREKLN